MREVVRMSDFAECEILVVPSRIPIVARIIERLFGLKPCGKPAPYLVIPTDADPLGHYLCEDHARALEYHEQVRPLADVLPLRREKP